MLAVITFSRLSQLSSETKSQAWSFCVHVWVSYKAAMSVWLCVTNRKLLIKTRLVLYVLFQVNTHTLHMYLCYNCAAKTVV